ncbi:unnamed protein product [Moneuplotes crassus]|uniref:Transcription initiation factor IIA gamma subunit N-terminal domain-containing protein n=1 Tax=Euplotes crassus TaxID=5936 RepID=A0AAD1XYP4_EUPCR|nr:unnamed protein product [Moneuplotes crassus]
MKHEFELYRQSRLGRGLEEVLKSMCEAKYVTKKQQNRILRVFDREVVKELVKRRAKGKTMCMNGTCVEHNNLHDKWKYIVEDPVFECPSLLPKVDLLRILTISHKSNPYVPHHLAPSPKKRKASWEETLKSPENSVSSKKIKRRKFDDLEEFT